MTRLSLDDALDLYGLQRWGAGFFGISPAGGLTVHPTGEAGRGIALPDVIRELRARGLDTPLVLRFPQILAARLDGLVGCFERAFREFGCEEQRYRPVYPIKVNQRPAVVGALLRAGQAHRLGLEVGSRAELLAALALPLPDDGLITVNGYKDLATLELAVLGARAGRRVVVVLEKLFEVDLLLQAFANAGPGALPEIGLRARLYARGAGKWWRSSGVAAKFGLTTTALLRAVARLEQAGHLDRLAMLHFHIGSQIPEIGRLKIAFREGARIYAKLRGRGVPLGMLNIGGGLAVDYDGSRTASDASMNYSMVEYANDAVFLVQEVCRAEKVPLPEIVSESGRALTAHHSMLVTDVLETIRADAPGAPDGEPESPQPLVRELTILERGINAKNWREYFHDAVMHRDELITLFNVGLISLEERAFAQQLFWSIARQALALAGKEKTPPPEFDQLRQALDEKYVLNFSLFQSAPDHWAIDQLFPIVPLARLREAPSRRASLVDITCDSDGQISRFIDIRDNKESLELHDPHAGDEPYDLAILLLGAYQDVMGDMHNLFGTPDEAHVVVGEAGAARIETVVRGQSAADVLASFGYDPGALAERIEQELGARGREGRLDPAEGRRLAEVYRARLAGGSYLSRRR
jgi:arginine decarboxylase